jgi:uncharacterized protein (DUF1697 family)
MPIYVAMLRGINLGGHKKVKMDLLRGSLETLGLKRVQTYIQSGNVVFQTGTFSPSELSTKIEKNILKDFGFPVLVILRTSDDLARTVKNNPFLKQRGVDPEKLHVTFLPDAPEPSVLQELAGLTTAPDQSCCVEKEIYLYLPNGMAHSSLTNNPLERRFLNRATTRNWRTVNQVYQMCVDCG